MAESIGDNSIGRLRSIVERYERLDAEVVALRSDQKDLMTEAKSAGYDVPALRALIRERKKDPDKVAELEAMLDVYRKALEGIADLPLGKAAIERVKARAA